MITEDNVHDLFTYCQETGSLFWKIRPSASVGKGSKVSYQDKDGYVIVRYKRKAYKAHRVVWLMSYGEWPSQVIDHRNNNPMDNRLCNLQDVSVKQNLQKICKPRGANRCVGVSFNKKSDQYVASIFRDGVSTFLGYFPDFFEAVCKRKSKENKVS